MSWVVLSWNVLMVVSECRLPSGADRSAVKVASTTCVGRYPSTIRCSSRTRSRVNRDNAVATLTGVGAGNGELEVIETCRRVAWDRYRSKHRAIVPRRGVDRLCVQHFQGRRPNRSLRAAGRRSAAPGSAPRPTPASTPRPRQDAGRPRPASASPGRRSGGGAARCTCAWRSGRAVLYHNTGKHTVKDTCGEAGEAIASRHSARGLAVGDIDNDGTLEVLVNNQNEPPSLWKQAGRGDRAPPHRQ